jgi:hypothetical protein
MAELIDEITGSSIDQPGTNLRRTVHAFFLSALMNTPYFPKFLLSNKRCAAHGKLFVELFASAFRLNAPFLAEEWADLRTIQGPEIAYCLEAVGTMTHSWINVLFRGLCCLLGRDRSVDAILPESLLPHLTIHI